MTNIVLITNGARPRLLAQTLRTLYENTPARDYNLTVVGDGNIKWPFSGDSCEDPINDWHEQLSVIRTAPPCHIVGRLKNLGAYWSEKQFGRGEWLCFLDDDMAFFPGWLDAMGEALKDSNQVRILGSVRHPFHKPNAALGAIHSWGSPADKAYRDIELTDAVAGYCHFMRWSTWDKFGPYDAHAKGTGQSEDFPICRKVVDAGGKVGYIYPPVMAHCGITNSEGKPILGGDLIERVPGVLYE
jgi:hypothetical protein